MLRQRFRCHQHFHAARWSRRAPHLFSKAWLDRRTAAVSPEATTNLIAESLLMPSAIQTQWTIRSHAFPDSSGKLAQSGWQSVAKKPPEQPIFGQVGDSRKWPFVKNRHRSCCNRLQKMTNCAVHKNFFCDQFLAFSVQIWTGNLTTIHVVIITENILLRVPLIICVKSFRSLKTRSA